MSSLFKEHFNKDNLHHAYLIEGSPDNVVPEILEFLNSLGIDTAHNPDFCRIVLDSFKVKDAQDLKSFISEKGITNTSKKIFLISANNFLLEAQNTLLKIFEEPIENTHFILITPNANSLLKTLVSRFYLIKPEIQFGDELLKAQKFLSMPKRVRIDFIKELLLENEEDGNSVQSKTAKFLNALEFSLHKKVFNGEFASKKDFDFFYYIFKVRKFLRQPGSSAKSLMEGVALVIPNP